MTIIAEAPPADDDRLRDGRLAGPDRRRVHVRERPSLRRRRGGLRRRPAASRSKGVVIAYDRRFASEHFAAAAAEVLLAHDIPVAYRGPCRADPDDLVRGRRTIGRGRDRDHREPQPVDRQRLQGQGADRRRPPGPEILAVLEARIASNGGTAIDRRPLADAEAAGLVERFDPYDGYERFLRRTIDLDALKAADVHVLVEPMWGAGAGWISASPGRWPHPGHRDPPGAQPVLRRGESGADPAERRRGARDPRRRRLRPRPVPRRRRGPRRRGRRAGHVHPPARGHRAAHVLPRRAPRDAPAGRQERQQHVDGRAARRALRHRRPRDPGRLQVHRPEDDRDRGDDRCARSRAASGSGCTCPSATASTPT